MAFDVRVERDAQELADSLGVKIFTADIIYHLFDSFMKHREVSQWSIIIIEHNFVSMYYCIVGLFHGRIFSLDWLLLIFAEGIFTD